MIFFLIIMLGAVVILQSRMGKSALNHVACSIRAEQYLVEPDDPFTLVYTVENRGKWPVLFLRASCNVPFESRLLTEGKGKFTVYAQTSQYRFNCFLMPRQQLEHRFTLSLPKRGAYRFENLTLAAGDFLGLREREDTFPGSCEVVILPPKSENTRNLDVAGGLMGEKSVIRWIHEDPILSAGFRDYTGREPQKAINWNRSLQSGKLMVRQMDHTAEERVAVLLSLWDGGWDQMEKSFSLCRSICESLENQGLAYSFSHNGYLMTSVGVLPAVEAGLGKQHLSRILEGLGRAVPEPRFSLAALIQKAQARGKDCACYLLIVPCIKPETKVLAAKLESQSGATVKIIPAE